MEISFLIFAKQKPGLDECVDLLKGISSNVKVVLGNRLDSFPAPSLEWEGDLLISYISPWIIPKPLLKRARLAAINFHPGPPEYPGIGCTTFAIYNRQKQYGVTVHHMEEKVDSGSIISVRRFPIGSDDTVFGLTQRCYENLKALFDCVIAHLLSEGELPKSKEKWAGKPYRRRDLDDLCKITPDMSGEEIDRRIRATTYPGMPGAFLEVHGHRFEYVDNRSFSSNNVMHDKSYNNG